MRSPDGRDPLAPRLRLRHRRERRAARAGSAARSASTLTEIGLQIGREAGRTRLARASVTAVPFPTALFDLVTSFDVLYALEDADERAAIAEMYRLLKPGGFAIVNVAAMKALRGDHSAFEPRGAPVQPQRAARRLQAAGFEVVRLTYTNATLFVPLADLPPDAAAPRAPEGESAPSSTSRFRRRRSTRS